MHVIYQCKTELYIQKCGGVPESVIVSKKNSPALVCLL